MNNTTNKLEDKKYSYQVSCIECGARPGEACMGPEPGHVHMERVKAAQARRAKISS